MNNFINKRGEMITVGLNYRFDGQLATHAYFTLVDIDADSNQAKLVAKKSKKSLWVDVDSLICLQTDGNKNRAERLANDTDGSYLKGLLDKQDYKNWMARNEVAA